MFEWTYAEIGKLTVDFIAALLALAVIAAILSVLLFAWVRGWQRVSDRMWKGYSIDDRPPLWKVRISGVALALARLQFTKVRPAYREAAEIADDEQTVRDYVNGVFHDD